MRTRWHRGSQRKKLKLIRSLTSSSSVDGRAAVQKSQNDAVKRKRDEDEEASQNVRRLSMQRLRDESTTPPRKRKEEEMRKFALQLKKQKIEARIEEREAKAA
ncbi:hypothetical protein GN958_ATG23650 [Phytophthora infestans]|uniref:Uncharacterized protein n=1 Tax=Phytophthora infestans TaxID=4787 RepID=A0A8S9THA1_PHYIN|nr:hypothetical protein GN958_ATG23650 [Phytophthora infestans]